MNPLSVVRRRGYARLRQASLLVFMLLVVEFLDEFVFGALEAALPQIRTDLNMNYEQIGLLLTIPGLLASLLFEPIIGILGDTGRRRVLVLGGGVFFCISTFLIAGSQTFSELLLVFILFFPSSGAFVSLSQSTLMDQNPARHEHNMARWTLAGSIGIVAGSLVVGAMLSWGLGWRPFYILVGVMTFITLVILWPMRFPRPVDEDGEEAEASTFREGIKGVIEALKRREVLRWLTLLEFSNFMLDILHGYLALYFVDVVGLDEAQAGFAVAIWTGVGLLGDLALIPLLERVRGISYLRFSAALEFVLYSAFLIVPGVTAKLILIAIIGFFNAGWYSITMGNLYNVLPGKSGSVLTLVNVFGVVSSFVPFLLGAVAQRYGLPVAMLFPLLGCVVLFIGLPRQKPSEAA